MPDVKEVYEMVTEQTTPKPDALELQRKRQTRHTRNQRLGAFAVLAAIAGLTLVGVRAATSTGRGRPVTPATQPSATVPATQPSATAPRAPEVDYVIDLNTRRTTPLPEAIIRSLGKSSDSGHYAASADGSMLAYVGTGVEGTPEIFIAGVEGTGVHQVTHEPIRAIRPAWSPDGTRIAYLGYSSVDVPNIFVLELATGQSKQVTDESSIQPYDLQFTPDGSSILFTSEHNVGAELRTVPVTGGKSTLLFDPQARGFGHPPTVRW
jgi:Tol biopolymer transport system component